MFKCFNKLMLPLFPDEWKCNRSIY